MNTNEAQQYLRRWQLVAEAEREELGCTTIETKIKQTAILMQCAHKLGLDTRNPEDIKYTREVWRKKGREIGNSKRVCCEGI